MHHIVRLDVDLISEPVCQRKEAFRGGNVVVQTTAEAMQGKNKQALLHRLRAVAASSGALRFAVASCGPSVRGQPGRSKHVTRGCHLQASRAAGPASQTGAAVAACSARCRVQGRVPC